MNKYDLDKKLEHGSDAQRDHIEALTYEVAELTDEVAELTAQLEKKNQTHSSAMKYFASAALFIVGLFGVSQGIEYSGWAVAMAVFIIMMN